MRAVLVAGVAAALALFALASLSPTAGRPRASVAEAPSHSSAGCLFARSPRRRLARR